MMNSRVSRRLQSEQRARRGPRGLRQGLVRLGLPDGPAAGGAGGHATSRSRSAAGTPTPTTSIPSRKRLLPELDKGMGALVADLAQRGLLDNTMIVWMGEFGRTPRINQNAGRDHWPRSWSVVDGRRRHEGRPGRRCDRQGRRRHHRSTRSASWTWSPRMTKTMGINLDTQYTTPRGRPMQGRRRRQADQRAGGMTVALGVQGKCGVGPCLTCARDRA